jgi:3-isopropylmalate/(R)-2-methylmalate dehydratase large subunit
VSGKTLFDKIWDQHVIADLGNGNVLLHVDRHLMHDLGGPMGFQDLAKKGLKVRNPELTFAVPDHAVSSQPGRVDETIEISARMVPGLRRGANAAGVRLFDINDPEQGIVHVVGPEQGITLPGTVLCCGDSHTSTHGGLGAMAFGIGSTELVHVLATQSLVQQRPKRMRVDFDGALPLGVTAKDMILHLIGTIGTAGGNGHAVEYAGSAIRDLPVEGRLTICNMSIEFGAKIGMVAPDDATYAYLEGRPFAPKGRLWEQALAHWQGLPSDPDAGFDRDIRIDVAEIEPQITWGTSPEHALPVGGMVPDPAAAPDAGRRQAWEAALAYMGLEPGRPIAGTRVDRVFIGSCTNSRLSDLRLAADVARGRQVARHVTAWVVPGSQIVKRQAEAEGLDKVFRAAGFEWREPGCSMCLGANGEIVAPGQRCVSTTNRNFVGRQGPRARTHLASPAMAAAAAIAGEITDVRNFRS